MVEGTVKEKVERNEKRRDISSCIYLSSGILSILSIYSSYLFPTLLHPILDKFPHKNGEPHQLHNSSPWPNTLNDSAAKCGAVSQADQEITHAALHPFTLKTQNIPTLGTRKRHIYSDNALPTPTIAGRSSPSHSCLQ